MSSPQLFKHGYALLIGVDANYLPNLALSDVAKDIAALHKVLTDPERCAYQADHVRVIAGTEATRQNILEALEWLQGTIATDKSGNATAFIYYSGHGWRDMTANSPQYYLIPYDMRENKYRSCALRADDFAEAVEAIQVQRLCVVLDCCHAGGMDIKSAAGLPDKFSSAAVPTSLFMGSQQGDSIGAAKGTEVLQQGAGRAILSSSHSHQPSYIRKDKQMSIFTYHLVEALSGTAQPQGGATEVLVSDVLSYVYRHVPQSAQADYGVKQTPDAKLSGVFPIALSGGGKGLQKGEAIQDSVIGQNIHPINNSFTHTGKGDLVGGDKIIYGDVVYGDKVQGDKIAISGGVSGQGIAIGRQATSTVNHTSASTDLTALFAPIIQAIMQHASASKQVEAIQVVRAIQNEVAKGQTHNDSHLGKLIDELSELIRPTVSTLVNTFASPILRNQVGPVTKFVLEKLQHKSMQL